jgi:protein-S-isoprenylcysteine O-methyltransferase Ste14
MTEGNMTGRQQSIPGQQEQNAAVRRRMVQVVVQFVVIVALLVGASGRVNWVWLWVYIVAGLVILAINSLVVPKDVIAERGRRADNVKSWDQKLSSISFLVVLALLVITGLDERWRWSPKLPLGLHLVGLVLLLVGQGIFSWAMASNLFFSTQVRLQYERGHAVATQGPYRLVRHPGYVGYIISQFGTAVVLGSLVALIPAALIGVLMIVRTFLEDRTLHQELEGYEEYAAQVRFRLIPGLW